VRYGDVLAVGGLSLSVPEGALYGLLGPNGAGKTTTLSCMAALRTPDSGTITIGGVDVRSDPAEARRQLGVVPQSLALYTTLTVAQNLRFFGGLFGLSGKQLESRVEWGLDLAQLSGRPSAVVDTLSGGMKRRLNLACALLHDPPIILCDEPTTGVDPQSRNHIFEMLRRQNAGGRTIVYTTHYMEEVEALCTRVAIMDHGVIIADDTLDNLLRMQGPTTRFTVEVADGADPARLREQLAAVGSVVDVRPAARGLEDVFLELTGRDLRDS
jgi:ABC-2 type transport system ATP-binding protein